MLDTAQKTLYELIKRYVTRQILVQQAIKDIRPDVFELLDFWTRYNHHVTKDNYDELAKIVNQGLNVPQKGLWGTQQEWIYFIHGSGMECRLSHTETGEVIDCGLHDIHLFDGYFFTHWLKSLIAQTNDDQFVKMARTLPYDSKSRFESFVLQTLAKLVSVEKLTQIDSSNMYMLIEK